MIATDNMMSRVVNDRTFHCMYCAVGLLCVATEKKKKKVAPEPAETTVHVNVFRLYLNS